MTSEPKKPRPSPGKLGEQIDENLRRVYEDTLNEQLPDRFHDLIAQLKKKDEGNGNDG